MKLDLVRATDETYRAWVDNLDLTFGFDYEPDEDRLRPLLDIDRTFGHFDGSRFVSTISAFALDMGLPGGSVPCGGTTVVSVSPAHRRQGLLSEMMARHFDDIREREEPIAALWASESEIYGRYGYGRATRSTEITVTRAHPRFSSHTAAPAKVALLDLDEAKELIPPLHREYQKNQPGMFVRTDEWWKTRTFDDPQSRRKGFTAIRWVAVRSADGTLDGYAGYRTKSGFGDDGHFAGEARISELFAVTPEAWAGLWSHVLNLDLTTKFVATLRSPDDALFDLLEGPRRAQATVSDGIWVRLMDVPTALTRRAYSAEFAGVFEVSDSKGIADGRFLLEATPEGSTCTPTDRSPDIELSVEDLGSAYLGDSGLSRMMRAGRVKGDPSVLSAADRAFGWHRTPWCPEIF